MKMTYVAEIKGKTFTRSSATRQHHTALILESPSGKNIGDWSWHLTKDSAVKAGKTLRGFHPDANIYLVEVVAYPYTSPEAKAARKASGKTS